jgi:hypothetical protein
MSHKLYPFRIILLDLFILIVFGEEYMIEHFYTYSQPEIKKELGTPINFHIIRPSARVEQLENRCIDFHEIRVYGHTQRLVKIAQ